MSEAVMSAIHEQMSGKIYLLVDQDHEGCFPLLTFFDKAKAETLKQDAEVYEKSKPQYSFEYLCNEDSKEAEEWRIQYEIWQLGHPVCSGFSGADNYQIIELEIRDFAEYIQAYITRNRH